MNSRHLTAARRNNCLRMFNRRCICVCAASDLGRHRTEAPEFPARSLCLSALGVASCVQLTEDNKGGVQVRESDHTFAAISPKWSGLNWQLAIFAHTRPLRTNKGKPNMLSLTSYVGCPSSSQPTSSFPTPSTFHQATPSPFATIKLFNSSFCLGFGSVPNSSYSSGCLPCRQ